MRHKKIGFLALCWLFSGLMVALSAQTAPLPADKLVIQGIAGINADFIRGVDISSLAQIEETGGKYYDEAGKPVELMSLLKARGVNWIRLRLWNNPVNELPVLEGGKLISNKGQRVGGGNNGLERTIELAKRAKKLGFKLLLDFHYSDFWADPSKQKKPAAWKDLHGAALEKALHDYTFDVIKKLVAAGGRPDMVQLGNETNNGFLWPDGQIWASKASEAVGGFPAFIGLLKQGAAAVREADPVKDAAKRMRIAVHLADGGKNSLYRSVFDPLTAAGLDFDIIGLSFYTYWHGSPAELAANLADLAPRYGKDLVVMETAYAFTPDDGDDFGNSFQIFNGPEGGYLPTVQGQATAVRDVFATVAGAPGGKGLGGFYWEPAWIPSLGAGWRTGEGNSWENQAMFDFKGKALPSLSVFQRLSDPVQPGLIQPVASEALKMTVNSGDALALPARVKAIMNDGSWQWAAADWDAPPPAPAGDAVVTVSGKLRGSAIAATALVSYTRQRNLIDDPSFESGKLGAWRVIDPLGASKVENNAGNAKTGNYTFKYWADKPFIIKLSRTFSGLAAGRYTFACVGMGGGGENSIRLSARAGTEDAPVGEAKTVPATNTGWKKWLRYAVEHVEVPGDSCTLSLEIDALAGNWGNFDDFEFYREID